MWQKGLFRLVQAVATGIAHSPTVNLWEVDHRDTVHFCISSGGSYRPQQQYCLIAPRLSVPAEARSSVAEPSLLF